MTKIIGLAALARSGKDTVASMLLERNEVAAYALADPLKAGCQALFGLTSVETWDDRIKEEIIPLWSLSPRQMFQQVGTDWMRNHNPAHWLMRADRQIHHSADITTPFASTDDLARPDAPIRLASQAFFGLSNEQAWDDSLASKQDDYWGTSPTEMFQLIRTLCETNIPNFVQLRAKRPTSQLETKQFSLFNKSVIIIKDIRFENEAEFWRQHGGVIWHIERTNAAKVNTHSSELGIKFTEQDTLLKNDGTLEELKLQVNSAWLSFTANASP
jgi:hypothetical protein